MCLECGGDRYGKWGGGMLQAMKANKMVDILEMGENMAEVLSM